MEEYMWNGNHFRDLNLQIPKQRQPKTYKNIRSEIPKRSEKLKAATQTGMSLSAR